MSITLNHSDFQCLQDQLVDLKTKNYELAEKNRRCQADFEAAKAKICSLQLKLEEQERDFQVTSTTLRREIEAQNDRDEEDSYKTKYKKLMSKSRELQQRYDKALEVIQQMDLEIKTLNDKVQELEDYNSRLKQDLEQVDIIKQECDNYQHQCDIHERRVKDITAKMDQQVEESRMKEKKGLQVVKELKRQLTIEKSKTVTLQKRIETLLSDDVGDKATNLSTTTSSSGDRTSKSNSSLCFIELSEAAGVDTKSETSSNHVSNQDSEPIEHEQVLLMERLTKLQQEKWSLEEKLAYLEQANAALSEELANKSEIIKNYFINKALKSSHSNNNDLPPFMIATAGARRISFPNHLLSENSSLKRVVDFVKERSQQVTSLGESESVSREATKKMQLMLEETLIKCLKLQENLDFVTNELNRLKS